MENDIQKLYDVLSRDGYYTKSFQEFTKQFEDDSYKQKVYDVTSRDGLYTKSYEEFISKYSFKKKDVSEVSTSGLEPGVSVSGETDDIFKNDYLLGIREGSIKKDSGEIFNAGEVIDAAKEQGYSQEDIDKMMIKTSSDPTLSKEVVKEPELEEVPSDLEEKIYQGIYGKALEQGDTSVPTIEQWKENPDLYTGMTSEEATEEALEMMTDPGRIGQAMKDIVVPALKNVEYAYDETFIGDLIRTVGSSTNPVLRQMTLSKKIENISADENLTEEDKSEKIKNLSELDAVWASEPFVNITDYTPEETNELVVGVLSTVMDFAATPQLGVGSGIAKVAGKILPSKTLLGAGKTTYDTLRGLGFGKQPAINLVRKQLPEFARRLDIAGTQFGLFGVAKDFQQQVDEYGGLENIDFSQSAEAFTKDYRLGAGLGLIGAAGRALPKSLAVGGEGVIAEKGLQQALKEAGASRSVILGTLGEATALTGEVAAFGLINAKTPTLENPEGELTWESYTNGVTEAAKFIAGMRIAGGIKTLAQGKPLFPTITEPKYTELNKAEQKIIKDIVSEMNAKVKTGEITQENFDAYVRSVINEGRTPITVMEKVMQEMSGMKSDVARPDVLKKIAKIEVQSKSDGTFDMNSYDSQGRWLTTRDIANIGEARESIESFNQERLEAPQGTYEPNVEVVMNLDPIQEIISPARIEFKIPRIDESPIDSPKPVLFNQPNPEAAEISSSYIEQRKDELELVKPEAEKVESLDIENSKRIADAYDELVDNPTDPAVKSAYDAMAKETLEQYASILDKGYKIEIWEGEGEPYKNSAEMIADVRDNKHMYIFGTEAGFGEGEITPEKRAENAMLAETEYKDVTGKTLLVNDVFRFVHDFFGHTELGNGFGPIGEENAWMVHSRMYSPEARRAMTTETRGQNSWVNFNKELRRDDGSIPKRGDVDYIPLSQRPFAEQKMGLLPDDVAFPEGAPVKAQAPVEAELGELEFYRAGKTDPKDLDPEMAKDFAKAVFLSKDKDFVQGWDKNKKYGEGDIKRIKVDIKNPFDTNNPDTWDAALKNKIFTRKQLETLRDRGEYLMEVDGVPEANYMQPTEENNWLIIEQKGEALKNAGYDSFYVYEKGARNVGVFNKGVYSEVTEVPAEVVPVEVKPSASLPIQPTEADAKMIEDMKAQGLPPLEIVLGLQESYIKQLPEGQPPMNEVALRQKAELILEGHENPEMTEDYFDMAAEMSKGKKGNIYDVINYLKKEAGRKLKKNFKPEGLMPRDAYTKNEFRVGAINKEVKQAEFNIRKLKKAVDKHNKANPDNQITTEFLNQYLSSYKYGIDPASRKGEVRGDSPRFSMESDFLYVSDVVIEKIFATKEARDEYLKGKDISKYDLKEKKLSEGTSRFYTYYKPEMLPDDIRIPLNKMRLHIDKLSNILLEQGVVSEKLALTISNNLGSYVHRTFNAFEKGSGISYESVRKNKPNDFKLAVNWFRRKVAPEVRKENPDLKGADLNKAIIDRVETEMKLALSPDSDFNMLKGFEKEFKDGIKRSILDAKKDVSALKTRQFVPDDLKGFLGEENDIYNNYIQTTLAVARIYANHDFQEALKEMFSGKVFFDNAVDVPKDMLKGDEAPVQMETTNQDIVDPLAGMWTTPEMKEAFSGDYAQMSGIVSKALAGAIGIHKVTQTILSFPSHAVNFFGNLGYLAANDVLTYKMKSTGKAMLESAKASWVTLGGKPSPELEKNYLEYVEMGIVGTSASAKDILKYIGDSQMITENPELYGSLKTKESVKTLGDLAKYPGKGLEALAKLWGAEDDFFKIIGYEVAKDKRLDIYMRNGMSETEAKRKIADEVKSEMPTFSRLPKVFRDVKSVRVVGTWLTYPVIALYSQIGTFSNAVDLLRNGNKWNEPELKKQGRRKAATNMGFIALASLLGTSLSYMFGEEDEEDYDNARFFVRNHQEESDIHISKVYGTRNSRGKIDGGKMVYYDFGASNAYGSTQKIMNIWLDRFESIDEISAEEEEKMLKEMFNEVGKNLEKSAKALGIDADPVTATVLEALTGFDGYGKRLYEVEDKLLDKALKGLSHILKRTMTPGSIKYVKKLTEAEDFKSELLSQLTGIKRREVNLLDEMQYASFKFGSDLYRARKELRKKMRQVSKGEMTMDEYKSIAEEKSAFLKDRVAQMHAMYMGAQSLMLKGEDGIRSSDKQDMMDVNTALQRKMILEGGLSREVVKRFILPNDYYDIISRVETKDSFEVQYENKIKKLIESEGKGIIKLDPSEFTIFD